MYPNTAALGIRVSGVYIIIWLSSNNKTPLYKDSGYNITEKGFRDVQSQFTRSLETILILV